MRPLFIAIGNPLRRDDGVAQEVLAHLIGDVDSLAVDQLTPEMADDIAPYDTVVFIDADAAAASVRIEPLETMAVPVPSSITHVVDPPTVIALARTLFGFAGQAYVCRIPVEDLSAGIGLSAQAGREAKAAADRLAELLRA